MSSLIVFLDQGVGKLIKGLVIATAAVVGPVTFLSAEPNLAVQDVRVVRMPGNVNRSARARIWGWVKYLVKGAWSVLFLIPGRPLLFIVSNPPVSPVLGILAKALKRQPYVLLFYDMYPEALENFKGMSRKSLVSRIWRRLNAAAVRHASAVITISPDLARTLRQYYQSDAQASKVEIVPTWADTQEIQPRPKSDNWFAQEHGQEGKLTVLYSGNIGAVHDLTLLPGVANQLRDYEDIHFLIIGEGLGREPLQAECARLDLHNVSFLPLQPESVLPFSLSTADISIIALARGGEGVSMPSKAYYMMSAGSALLGISAFDSDLESLISRHECGINVKPGDTRGAADAILHLRNNPDILQRYRKNARLAATEYYSADVCIPQMIDIFTRFL